MKDQLERRLAALRQEYESGQRALADLERKQSTLRDTLLRISGGIQVLEEELVVVKTPQNGKVGNEVAP